MYKISCLLAVLFLSVSICGCWDYRDLEEQDLPIAASYDRAINPPPGSEEYQRIVLGTLTPDLSKGKEGQVRIMNSSAPVVGMSQKSGPGHYWGIITPP